MGEVWFRGEAIGGPVSKPGGSIHDFGDGMYLTDRVDIAQVYASTRAAGQPDRQSVVAADINVAALRVLDLRTDTRWRSYFDGPGGKQALDIIKTGRMNEFYGESFQDFLKANKIDRNQYDVIIGPEYVRGGNQLCVVYKDGQSTSPLAQTIRNSFKPVSVGPPLPAQQQQRAVATVGAGGPLPPLGGEPKSAFGKVMKNQNAAAAIGVALGSGIQWLGDIGIERKVKHELETTLLPAVQAILNRGDGVLVIVRLEEWIIPDFNGMRARSLLSVDVAGGRTQEAALNEWRSTPKLLKGPAPGWQSFERYNWIPPQL